MGNLQIQSTPAPAPTVRYATWVTPENESQYIAPFEDENQMKEIADKPKIPSLKKQLLINGYIHQIQHLLKADTIIPTDIYLLCAKFYHPNITNNILWKLYKNRNDHGQLRQFGIYWILIINKV